MKLGVLTSHPIQYQAPLFRELAKRLDLRVFFAHRQTPAGQAAAGFGKDFEWDIDLLGGYTHEFLENRARHPDVSRFFGCDTPDIRTRIKREKFDAFLVMGWGLKAYWQAVNACRDLGIPVMVRGDSQLGISQNFIKRALKKIVYPFMLRRFDACLYVGQRNEEYLSYFGVDQQRLFYSPHCVDNDWFRRTAESADLENVRRNLLVEVGENIALFVGKFIEIKQPLDLVEALSLLKKQGTRVRGVFVGSGPLEAKIVNRAKELKVPITLTGFVNQSGLPVIMAASDMLVLCSTTESWGLVANEALACGTPVVVSDGCGCQPDLAASGESGCSFKVGDQQSLTEAMETLLEKRPNEKLQYQVAASHSVGVAANGIINAIEVLTSRRKLQDD